MRFKYYYLNLSLFQKIEFYLIPLFILIFLYLNFDNTSVELSTKNEQIILQEIKKYKLKIKNTDKEHKIIKFNQIQILKQYELLSQKVDVDIINISFQGDNLYIDFSGKFINSINYLYISEKMNKIISVSFRYEKSKLYIKSIFNSKDFNNIDMENLNMVQNIANPFIKIKDKNSTRSSSKAIVGDYVIFDDIWYKAGDSYQKYIIYKIYDNYIELKYGEKIIKMEIFD